MGYHFYNVELMYEPSAWFPNRGVVYMSSFLTQGYQLPYTIKLGCTHYYGISRIENRVRKRNTVFEKMNYYVNPIKFTIVYFLP